MNERLFRAKLVERGLTVEDVAKGIGINRATLYRKLKNDTITTKQANDICKYLQLNVGEITNIFFEDTVAYYANSGV